MEGTNKAHENGEAMGFVGVRLTVMLGHGYWLWVLHFMCESVMETCKALFYLFFEFFFLRFDTLSVARAPHIP